MLAGSWTGVTSVLPHIAESPGWALERFVPHRLDGLFDVGVKSQAGYRFALHPSHFFEALGDFVQFGVTLQHFALKNDIQHVTMMVWGDAFGQHEQAAAGDGEAGFFLEFADQALFQSFAKFQAAARQEPIAAAIAFVANEKDLALADEHAGDADFDRPHLQQLFLL